MNYYRYRLISLIVLLFLAGSVYPQKMQTKNQLLLDTFKTKNIFKTTHIAAPFLLTGIILYNPGKRFQNLRKEFASDFSSGIDDYLQYTPTLALYGLKLGGVKGKSSWTRLLTTNVISALTMTAIVNGIKYTVQEPRPYGYGNNSYPSGHTAYAFMSANMVHHEYGLTRSPWYSIGAYSLATATAIMRILNNKHYIHDVVLGAGIGILSTELGYLFSDLIFKGKGILLSDKDFGDFDIGKPSSYLGLTMGFNKVLNRIPITSSVDLKTSWGSTTGIEGVYYFNWNLGKENIGSNIFDCRNLGLGVNASVSTATTSVIRGNFSFTGPTLAWYNIGIGPVYSISVTKSCRLGGKLFAGYSSLLERSFNDYTIVSSKGFDLTTGVFVEQYITQGMLIKLYTNLEKTFYTDSRFNLLNVVSGASVCLDLGIVAR